MRASLLILIVLALLPGVSAVRAQDDDVAALLEGVSEIASPGVPGPICAFGKDAFSCVLGGSGEAVVAGTRFGRGRIVAFGHGGYFGRQALETKDTMRLLENAVRWAGRADAPRVGLIGYGDTAALLGERMSVIPIPSRGDWRQHLGSIDVLVASDGSFAGSEDREAIAKFVKRGGGLITAGLVWGWKQLNPGKDPFDDHPINPFLAETGLLFADGYHEKTSGAGYRVDGDRLALAHAGRALAALEAQAKGQGLSKSEIKQAAAVLLKAAQTLPRDEREVMRPLRRLLQKRAGKIVPSAKAPLAMGGALDRVLLALALENLRAQAPHEIDAHPAGALFPGAVPKRAKRVTKTLTIHTSPKGAPREGPYSAANADVWHGTGLYAAPGEVVTVAAPASVVPQKAGVRIGAHTDKVFNKDSWSRAPEVSWWRPFKGPKLEIASPFGGLVYVTVPVGADLGAIEVKVKGAVEAPRFVAGETTPEAWKAARTLPGPWAELESDKLILTVPSEAIRDLDDPAAVMSIWDEVMDACADLAVRPRERAAPERICADVQISNGYMHSGYPIMTHLDVIDTMVDVAKIRAGSWGFFHELGHNHQSADWTFAGTTEVTVNLFSLYVYEKVCGQPPDVSRKNVPAKPEKLGAYVASGEYGQWKQDPWLALTMYWQIQQAFGWDVFKQVFTEYRGLSKDARPKNDAEKRDQWLVRLSKTVGKDLGPFFQAWRVPTSQTARDAVADLPAWMPDGFPR